MSFEEIQSIWDSQNRIDQAVDRDALRAWILGKKRSFERIVSATEIVMTLTLIFVGGMFLKDPLLEGHDRILMVAGIASLLAAAFVWTGRIARRRRELAIGESLLGIVKSSIAAVDYQITRMQSFVWWFAGPMSLGLVIGLVIVDDSKRYLFYTIFIPAFVVCIVLAYWQIRREIRLKLIPERTRLARLQDELMDDQASTIGSPNSN